MNGTLTRQEEARVREALSTLQQRLHNTARDKGWWEQERSVPELIALCHSELSEALECYRDMGPTQEAGATWIRPSDGKPEGCATEFADVIIRVLDTCQHLGIDLADALILKHQYNQTRSHRHGGKRA